MLERLTALFPGRLYVELMRHGLAAEDAIEPALIELASRPTCRWSRPTTCTSPRPSEYEAHDALLCIADGAQVGQEQRRRLTPEHRFKTAAEMRELFADLPEAIDNTLVIARRCAFMVPTPRADPAALSRPRPGATRPTSCAARPRPGSSRAARRAGALRKPTSRRRRRPIASGSTTSSSVIVA